MCPKSRLSNGLYCRGWKSGKHPQKEHSMNDIKTKRALDRALISLGSGDADSLEAVYELSARRLYSVCYLITGNREDAEDALHNAMLRICRYSPDYKSQNGAWAYLFTIARHAALDIVDRRKKFDPVENTDLCGLSSHATRQIPKRKQFRRQRQRRCSGSCPTRSGKPWH